MNTRDNEQISSRKALNFGRKKDGSIATPEDWATWRREFWEREGKIEEEWGSVGC